MMQLRCVALLAALVAGSPAPREPAPPAEITVFAAASLAEAFRELGAGTRVRFNFAGSQQLALQLEQGARADVFASADRRWMQYLQERGLTDGEPRIFAHNRLAVIVPRTNPGRVHKLEDLARRGLKLVVGAAAVPVGQYTREAIRNLGDQAGFPPGYTERVLANVVSQEENARSVVAKVQLGEADAGFVYRSDVTPQAARHLTILELPDSVNVLASYPIAVMDGSADTGAARRFVELVLGPEGRRVLARHGLMPAGATP
jgi:molybdate transport system substrate-binding protein